MELISKKEMTQELSQRWIQEGKEFKDGLNAFLDSIYIGGERPEEPSEEREDMAPDIYNMAIAMNESGEHKELRELFPPAFEPFEAFYDNIAKNVNQIIVLKDGGIIARADGNVYLDDGIVYRLDDDKITEQEGIMAFGISSNKEYVVKVTKSAVQVHSNWDDKAIWTSNYPDGYGEAAAKVAKIDFAEEGLIVLYAEVFNDGKRVVLTTTNGIFILSENDSKCLFPTQEMIPEYIEEFYEEYESSVSFEIGLSYFHSKLSPDNSKIAVGFQGSEHYIFDIDGDTFKVSGTIQARSEYPHAVGFHDKLNHVALASCHYQQSGIIGMDLSHLPIKASASWYDDPDERFDEMHDNMWIYSILPYKDGYLLGSNNGYMWYIDPKDPKTKTYLHLGGVAVSMDYSIDKKYLVVGTISGYVIKIDLTAPDRDKTLITNMKLRETNRWALWNNTPPLIW